MKKLVLVFLVVLFELSASYAESNSDQQIVQNIINESIANYSGRCPCPYNRASNGSSCGKRSAYSRAGGYSPLCYDSDVTSAMISSYKHKHGIRQ
jgi:hypothetical protein